MKKFIIGMVIGFAVAYAPNAVAQEYHANGVEIWGYYEGEAYWHITEYGGKLPMVSGGTLYVPSKKKAPKTASDRVVENATTGAATAIESGINNTIDRLIYDLSNKIFKY